MNTPIKRALISVSDKRGIVEFARALGEWQIEILSTGGTFEALRAAGVSVRSVSEYTGFPEILDGRVKTLHPKIHGGLLGIPEIPSHAKQMADHAIGSIDLLVVNLYPFEATIARTGVTFEEAIEQIDIGGPAMLRSAAKNFHCKTVLTDPAQYGPVIDELKRNGGQTELATRRKLAQEVFAHTARYDAAIARYLTPADAGGLPEQIILALWKEHPLRYGENPHQSAAVYGASSSYFEQLHGKELSFNNYVDMQAAAELVEEFDRPAAVIVKHTNPCGAGTGATLAEAYEKALATDPKSAFGGIVAFNRPVDMAAAAKLDAIFTEVVIAPEFPEDVIVFFRRKKDRRIIRRRRTLGNDRDVLLRHVAGGVLAQTRDDVLYRAENLRVVTERRPTDEERASMEFAWRVAKHVKSNAIIYARADRTVGVGAGQMSRVDSSRIAALKARDAGLDLHGTALASDAFFPFADGLLEAINAGATAVIQPGGSVRDAEVISAANEHNIAMIFTGMRHFRH